MSAKTSLAELREAVAVASRQLGAKGLLPGTAGNVSARQGDLIAVTATGAVLADLTAEQVTVVDLDGAVQEGRFAPTSELDLHLGIYHSSSAGAVVHTHSPMATTLSLVIDELPVVHYQQLELGGTIRVAPFAVFGTQELADNVKAALDGRLAAIMASHGSVAQGATLAKAAAYADLLEWLCTLYWQALAIGKPRLLTPEQQQAVIEHALATGYGETKARD